MTTTKYQYTRKHRHQYGCEGRKHARYNAEVQP